MNNVYSIFNAIGMYGAVVKTGGLWYNDNNNSNSNSMVVIVTVIIIIIANLFVAP